MNSTHLARSRKVVSVVDYPMRVPRRLVATCLFAFVLDLGARAALGDPSRLGTGSAGDLMLAKGGTAAPLFVATDDWPGVQRAARDLQADIERVTGLKPEIRTTVPGPAPMAVLIGTVGRSTLIDGLIKA